MYVPPGQLMYVKAAVGWWDDGRNVGMREGLSEGAFVGAVGTVVRPAAVGK